MADIVVSVSMGVMKPVLEKLAILMGEEYKKLKGLRKKVSFLKRELSDMNAVLEKMDDADELDPLAKNWRKEIIDMSYDIEDYIDDFMSRVGEAGDNVGARRKAFEFLKSIKIRRHLANQFQEIKDRVIQASERRKRYMLLDQCIPSSNTTHVIVDPRLSALYQKSTSLVGIDSQKKEIIRWVMDDEGQQLKVMSIVGFGGLGKTTLANEVYREVGAEFHCKAFVPVSQKPSIIKLLNSLRLQLGLRPYSHDCEPKDLIDNIIKHLRDMRYFIVVDDLWDIEVWNIIRCAFPPNNHHSRVMITTRIENVARACCGNHGFIHNMKPLSEQDSRKLFFDRIWESEDACPPDFIQVSYKILKKCGGLPLAIITMASMIACQPTTRSKGQWAEYIQNSLGAELFATNQSYEEMMHIIDFSYKNLPRRVKACFLYLGTYPEDHKISRIELVRRWVVEGFVSCSHGQDVWDVAESYFSELINRSMIQPAYEYYDDTGIEVTHCRVHDMMLQLILRKCGEDNFINLIDASKMMPKGQDKVVRRLIIDLRGVEGGIMVLTNNTRHLSLSRVRSLNIFGGYHRICRIPNLAEFKFMRLLFLDVYGKGNIRVDLSGINHLSQLRYLRVERSIGLGYEVLLPPQIQGLRFLETLDISHISNFNDLPEIVDVPRLSHLSVSLRYGSVGLPHGIGKVKSLLTLSEFDLARSSLQSITGLGELTALSELILHDSTTDNNVPLSMKMTLISALITSLENLGNLRNLVLYGPGTVYCGDAIFASWNMPSFSPPFRKIERLCLALFIFSHVPKWIGHHCYLRELRLVAKQINQEDLNIIGTSLTSLVSLNLWIVHIPTERIIIGGLTGFNVLKRFDFNCDGASCLTFEAGAMPDLQKLELVIDPDEWDKATPVGLQHLPSLKRIDVKRAESRDAAWRRYEEMETMKELMRGVFQEAADALPTRPAVHIQDEWVVRQWERGR